jgi:hypothetical protein
VQNRRIETARATVDIGVTEIGDDVRLDAMLRSDTPLGTAFLALRTPPGHEQSFGQATVLTPPLASGFEKYALSGLFGEIRADELPPINSLELNSISLAPDVRRLGLLCINEAGNEILSVTLHTFDGGARMTLLGGRTKLNELETWAATVLEDVSNRLISGQPFSERIYSIGVTLAQMILTPDGRNVLASYLREIDHLVIFSNRLSVPWEWLVPGSIGDAEPLRAIGDVWRITRWPWNTVEGVVRVLSTATKSTPLLPLSTLGLPVTSSNPWRLPPPTTMADVVGAANACRTLHLVVHWTEKKTLSFECGIEVDEMFATTHPLRGPSRLIISGCNAAAAASISNLVATLSSVSGVPAWAPLVKMRDSDAEMLDNRLQRHTAAVDDFMTSHNETEPLTRLYVRYGLPI